MNVYGMCVGVYAVLRQNKCKVDIKYSESLSAVDSQVPHEVA